MRMDLQLRIGVFYILIQLKNLDKRLIMNNEFTTDQVETRMHHANR